MKNKRKKKTSIWIDFLKEYMDYGKINKCPFCSTDSVEVMRINGSMNRYSIVVRCSNCKKGTGFECVG